MGLFLLLSFLPQSGTILAHDLVSTAPLASLRGRYTLQGNSRISGKRSRRRTMLLGLEWYWWMAMAVALVVVYNAVKA